MPIATPAPATWTLRLKYHKTTVLLHVEPLQSLSSVKTELLHALRETCPDGIVDGKPLPADADALELAKMADVSDPEKGWVLLTGEASSGGNGSAKGKGKSAAGEASLKAEGVKDNAVLAFRWGGEGAHARDNDVGDGDAIPEIEEGGAADWDVVLPRYEDTYMDGLEDEGIAE